MSYNFLGEKKYYSLLTIFVPSMCFTNNVPAGPAILLMYNAGPVDVTWANSNNEVVSILENFYPAQVNNLL